MDKWAGFCNLCGKSYSSSILPLLDEYQHMIDYHIKREHDQRLNSKENIDEKNVERESQDSDCILLSQPSETNLNEPTAPKKNENEATTSVLLAQVSTDNIQEQDNSSNVIDLPKSPLQLELPSDEQDNALETAITNNTDTVLNGPEVPPQNTEINLENPAPKQMLRFKCLPGDKLSGKNDASSDNGNPVPAPYVDPEMTFGELTELELAKNASSNSLISVNQPALQPAVQETPLNHSSPPLSQIPEGCVPQTTPEQEATLLAVIEENISRYSKIITQPQQPVNIRSGPILPSAVQSNSIVLHTTSNALVTYTPPTNIFNTTTSTVQPMINQSYQSTFINMVLPSRSILPDQSYQTRPTAAIAPSPKSNFSDVEARIPNTVLISNSNNAQNSNAFTNTKTSSVNCMNTYQNAPLQPVTSSSTSVPATVYSVQLRTMPAQFTVNPINGMQNAVSSILNQNPGPSHNPGSKVILSTVSKTRSMRPWLNKDDLKYKSIIDKCFKQEYLTLLYKCMFIACSFATDKKDVFRQHLECHRQAVLNPNSVNFHCSYCLFSTTHVENLLHHMTEKYSRCNFHCSRCFYRTCSQYSAIQHIKIHENVGSTKLFIDAKASSVLEDKEFKLIKLRELPALRCICKYSKL
jgi:hypothetical protein